MSDNQGSNINAFLFGLIIGGVLGVLFAPDEGKETRRRLKEKYGEWSEKLLEAAEGLKGEAAPQIERVVETLRPLAEEAAPVIESISERAEENDQPYSVPGGVDTSPQGAIERRLSAVKGELDDAVSRARRELERRPRRSDAPLAAGRANKPRFFKGI